MSEEQAIEIIEKGLPDLLKAKMLAIQQRGIEILGYALQHRYATQGRVGNAKAHAAWNLEVESLGYSPQTQPLMKLVIEYLGGHFALYVDRTKCFVYIHDDTQQKNFRDLLRDALAREKLTPAVIRLLFEDIREKTLNLAWDFERDIARVFTDTSHPLDAQLLRRVFEYTKTHIQITDIAVCRLEEQRAALRATLEHAQTVLLASKSFAKSKQLAALRVEVEQALLDTLHEPFSY